MKNTRFFFGWIILGVSFITLTVSFGIWYSFSVFFVSLLKETGGTRAATAGVFSLFMVTHAVAATGIGSLLDRFGARRIIPAFSLLAAIGLLLSSRISSLGQLYFSYSVITAIGICGIGHFAQTIILPNWFIRKRGLAIGIAMAGSGVGMQVIIPFTQRIISQFGWRTAYLVLALMVFLVVFPLNGIFQRKGPEEVDQHADGEKPRLSSDDAKMGGQKGETKVPGRRFWGIVKKREFWLLLFNRFATPMATQAILIHQVAHVVDKGFSPARGAFFFGLSGLTGSVAKVLFGHFSDRVGRNNAYTIGMGCAFIGVFSLMALRPGQGFFLLLYALFFGIGYGAIVPLFPARAADLYSGPQFGKIYGLLSIAGGLGSACGSWLSGKVHDMTGNYNAFFVTTLVLLLCSAVSFSLTSPKTPHPS